MGSGVDRAYTWPPRAPCPKWAGQRRPPALIRFGFASLYSPGACQKGALTSSKNGGRQARKSTILLCMDFPMARFAGVKGSATKSSPTEKGTSGASRTAAGAAGGAVKRLAAFHRSWRLLSSAPRAVSRAAGPPGLPCPPYSGLIVERRGTVCRAASARDEMRERRWIVKNEDSGVFY